MNRIKDWINNHKKQTTAIVIILIIILCAGSAITVTLINKSKDNDYNKNQSKTDSLAGNAESSIANTDNNNAEASDGSNETLTQPGTETTLNDSSSNPEHGDKPDSNSGDTSNSASGGNSDSPSYSGNTSNSENTPGSNSSSGNGSSGSGNSSGHTPDNPDNPAAPHVHTWVNVSPENSYHTEYGAECRIHGYSGEEPMFFKSQNDLFLHHAADGCNSSWGSGFKGIAYKYCSGCGEEVITGHVHDFGTVEKTLYSEKIICECGMEFSAGKDYTALESWERHVESYVSHGAPRDEHDSYTTGTSSITRYEATKTCSCGWRPVDNRPIY